MHTQLKLHDVSPEQLLHDYVDRRLYFGLSRFGGRIGRVTTRISASAGSTSHEVTCRIAADLRPAGVITAEASDIDVYAAIDRAVGRLARRCQTKCARLRNQRTRRESLRLSEHQSAA